ncbi:Dihydrofolate reductase type 3 [Nocardioides dokdonensis FR1436]|uniref:Dihydrofolate reductase n=1 Tax=Nocardioides dokdonensis FR1436 TaxID=1300347 RepID=A0A1A9GML0_9ACTN|nr:dihydrofolate reductase [Nocardioides dokdonensis]ANH39306.1 Dihydrofolate reductase type 3 [Nocardioides dokdonensis FR1436]
MTAEHSAGRRVVLVAAYGRNRVIGADGEIPWHLPEDFAHFKRETLGHVLVMGRRTWDSIGRPLPGRSTVVLTRDPAFDPGFEGVHVVRGLEEALEVAAELPGDVVVAGGGEVYRLALPLATHQVLTEVDLEPAGDATYPDFPLEEWAETRREHRPDLGLDWVWWERRVAAS